MKLHSWLRYKISFSWAGCPGRQALHEEKGAGTEIEMIGENAVEVQMFYVY